jgi:hypothetical protein
MQHGTKTLHKIAAPCNYIANNMEGMYRILSEGKEQSVHLSVTGSRQDQQDEFTRDTFSMFFFSIHTYFVSFFLIFLFVNFSPPQFSCVDFHFFFTYFIFIFIPCTNDPLI